MKQSESTTASHAESTSTKSRISASNGDQDAVALLTADHRAVEQLFEQYQGTSDQTQKAELQH